jgi:hypothetical protein
MKNKDVVHERRVRETNNNVNNIDFIELFLTEETQKDRTADSVYANEPVEIRRNKYDKRVEDDRAKPCGESITVNAPESGNTLQRYVA